MKKQKTKIIIARIIFGILVVSLILVFFGASSVEAINFTYRPLERIPGFESVNIADFPTLIQTIYKFALWVVGICALFMITFGGFSYLTSAGNNAKSETGKRIITDAVIGLVLVLVAVLIFTVINPNITTVDLQIAPAAAPTSP